MTEQPVPSVNDDPRTWYMPYDLPDMTEEEYDPPLARADQMCTSSFDVDGDPANDNIVHCTRPLGHKGSHMAGDCDRIIVIWDPPAYRIEEEPV